MFFSQHVASAQCKKHKSENAAIYNTRIYLKFLFYFFELFGFILEFI